MCLDSFSQEVAEPTPCQDMLVLGVRVWSSDSIQCSPLRWTQGHMAT